LNQIKTWIQIGTILNACMMAASALIAAFSLALVIAGILTAKAPASYDYMSLISIIVRALLAVFAALAPFMAGLAGAVFLLSFFSFHLGRTSLNLHRNRPYEKADLGNTAVRISCNGLLFLAFLFMLIVQKFQSPLMICIVIIQLIICILQIKEIRAVNRQSHPLQHP
jgi:hypothetical protein